MLPRWAESVQNYLDHLRR